MTRRPYRFLLALLLPIALFAAACGDDSDTDTSSGEGGGGTLRFTPYDAGGPLTKAALKSDEIQVALIFTSDADIAVEDWVLRTSSRPSAKRSPRPRCSPRSRRSRRC
jgi:hypothetical protein